MSEKAALNQVYQEKKTFEDHPEIKKIYDDYIDWCLNDAGWHKYGRAYDCSVALKQIDFKDKIVCELGARDSIFSSYLTKIVEKIYASDTFMGWGDLGDLKFWENLWDKFSFDKSKHVSEYQDMQKLSYEDNSMDVVVSFSAIEHIPNGGDILAAKEMGRVCKPGGKIVIGTDMCSSHQWHHGGYFYDEKALFERIIESTGCSLVGTSDFNFDNSEKHELSGLDYTSTIFVLKKEEG